MSARASSGWPVSCSGDMYVGVQECRRTCRCRPLDRSWRRSATARVRNFATPKSSTLIDRPRSAGCSRASESRWTPPCARAPARPEASCRPIRRRWAAGTAPRDDVRREAGPLGILDDDEGAAGLRADVVDSRRCGDTRKPRRRHALRAADARGRRRDAAEVGRQALERDRRSSLGSRPEMAAT